MALLPFLPQISGESLTSYVNRTALYQCNLSLQDFLRFFEISQQALMNPGSETLERISGLTSHSVEQLAKMAFLRSGNRRLTIKGEIVHSGFIELTSRPFCPACLLADLEADSPSDGVPVGRLAWQLQPVRVCERHGVTLQARKFSKHSDRFYFLPELIAEKPVLTEMLATAEFHEPSRLQKYVVDRLDGGRGPEWLDGQRIDYAARACEMLGVILDAGTHINLQDVTNAQWSAAGDLGFGYASNGAEGIRSGLQLALDRYISNSHRGGPQMAFGRLYQWLQFNQNNKPAGPIRDIMREFILDNFPIEPGKMLMGSVVERQRVHSVHSLARKTGAHPKTIHRAIVLSGLADGDIKKVYAGNVFDAVAAENLMERVRTSLSVANLQCYLNCNRVQAEQLSRTGIVRSVLPDGGKALGALYGITRKSADDFLDNLLGAAKQVTSAQEGMLDIASAAEASRWPVIDIVRGILSGLFMKVEVVDLDFKFKGVLVDPVEVRFILKRNQLEGCVGIEEAAQLIGMPQHGLNKLVRMRKKDGKPYITERIVMNAKDVPVRLFTVDEILAFRRDHLSLKDIAETEMCSPKVMKMKLDERGLAALAPKHELGRVWYRRADLKVA